MHVTWWLVKENGWLITTASCLMASALHHFPPSQKNSFPLTSTHSLSATATGTSFTPLVVWSFPKALSLLAASFSTHPAHHLNAHETNVSQVSCARKKAPRVGSHFHQRNRRERLFADVGLLAEIGDGDLEKCHWSMASRGKKSTANREILIHPGSTWCGARARQQGN